MIGYLHCKVRMHSRYQQLNTNRIASCEIVLLIVIVLFLVLLPAGIYMTGVGIGLKYMGVQCDDTSSLSLATYLFVSVGIGVFAFISGVILFFFAMKRKSTNILCIIMTGVIHGIAIIWSMIGLTYLVLAASGCKETAFPLWIMTILTFITQWIGFLTNFIITLVLYCKN